MSKVRCPDYYREFVCIAGDCQQTCCAGWEVVVDDVTAKRYLETPGPFGDRLRRELQRDEDDYVFPAQNGRCPFLNEHNLCDIYLTLGEDALCRTCDKYPRFDIDFGGHRECGLSVSCLTAAEKILAGDRLPEFYEEDDGRGITPNQTDPMRYRAVLTARAQMFRLLEDRQHSLQEVLTALLQHSSRFQKLLRRKNYAAAGAVWQETCQPVKHPLPFFWMDALCRLEQLRPGWHNRVREVSGQLPGLQQWDAMLRRLCAYYLWRYVSEAVFDADLLTPVKFAVFATVCTAALIPAQAGWTQAVETAAAFSREVEHSAENLQLMRRILARERKYTTKRMLRTLYRP